MSSACILHAAFVMSLGTVDATIICCRALSKCLHASQSIVMHLLVRKGTLQVYATIRVLLGCEAASLWRSARRRVDDWSCCGTHALPMQRTGLRGEGKGVDEEVRASDRCRGAAVAASRPPEAWRRVGCGPAPETAPAPASLCPARSSAVPASANPVLCT